MSDVDNLKNTRRLQAHRIAQKLRLQPLNYVEKSVVTQNEWEKIGLAKRISVLDRNHEFDKHKRENERRQFVIEKRRLLKPVFDGSIPTAGSILDQMPPYDPDAMPHALHDDVEKPMTSLDHGGDKANVEGRDAMADDAQVEHGVNAQDGLDRSDSAFPDLDSELLRIVEYFEIHKPNTVKHIRTVKHLSPQEEKQMKQKKHRIKQNKLDRLGGGTPRGFFPAATPRVDMHAPNGSITHRGDFTDKEREGALHGKELLTSSSMGFYLSTGRQPVDLNASIDSVQNANRSVLEESYGSTTQLGESTNTLQHYGIVADELEHNDMGQPVTTPIPQPSKHGALVPLHIVPPAGPKVHSILTPDKRFQSPPSTKKFRNYKVRTSMSDRGKLNMAGGSSLAPTPVARKGKSQTPQSDFIGMRHQTDSADVFGASDADFKAALTESNLKLHAMRQVRPGRRTPRPEPRRGLVTPSLATSLENLTIDEYEVVAHKTGRKHLRVRSRLSKQHDDDVMTNPFVAAGENTLENNEHTKAVHETIPERAKRTRTKLFKSKRYGDNYLVPSDVKRTCHDIPFDPYVLAIHKKEIDEIETRKRLEDIKAKLNHQRQNQQSIQSNVNEWMKSVDQQAKTRATTKIGFRQSWSNFA